MELTINKINSNYVNLTNNKTFISKKNNSENSNKNFKFPSYNFYNQIAFCGGISLDLDSTRKHVDTLPKGLLDEIENTLSNANPENKTLIDVQKDYYSLLDNCKTMEDVKILYPEFCNVKSDSEVPIIKGTFVDKVKNDKIEGFDKDTDVALQLLRLYWGQGFSFSDLQKNYSGTNFFKLFDKLNIPTRNVSYAKCLSYSDKGFNELNAEWRKFLAEQRNNQNKNDSPDIETKQKNTEIQNSSNNSVEIEEKIVNSAPVQTELKANNTNSVPQKKEYSPKGPMPQAQKDAISEALTGRVLTDEHKKAIGIGVARYFVEHPEQKDKLSVIMSQVTLRAWNYPDGLEIRRKMSKFMKNDPALKDDVEKISKKILSEDDMNLEELLDENKLAKFWKRNPESRKMFSKCMLNSWTRQREIMNHKMLYEPLYECSYIPEEMKKDFKKYNGFELDGKIFITDKRDNHSENYIRPRAHVTNIPNIPSEILSELSNLCALAICDTIINQNTDKHMNLFDYITKSGKSINNWPFIKFSELISYGIQQNDTILVNDLIKNLNQEYKTTKTVENKELYIHKKMQNLSQKFKNYKQITNVTLQSYLIGMNHSKLFTC